MMVSISIPEQGKPSLPRLASALADDLAWVPVVQDLVAARVAPEELVPTLQRETPECYRARLDDAGWLAVARLLLI